MEVIGREEMEVIGREEEKKGAGEELDFTYFDSIHRDLCLIENHPWWTDQVRLQLQLYKSDIKFLQRFLRCSAVRSLSSRYDTDTESWDTLQWIWEAEGRGSIAVILLEMRESRIFDWSPLQWEMEGRIDKSKVKIERWCNYWSTCSLEFKENGEILVFLDVILNNLKDLLSYKAGIVVPLEKQMLETLEVKLVFLQNFIKLTANGIHSKDLLEQGICIHIFVNDAACLTFMDWVNTRNGGTSLEGMDLMLSDLMQKIEPCTRYVSSFYDRRTLLYKSSRSADILVVLDALLNSLKDLVRYKSSKIFPFMKRIEILEEKLVFLRDFLKLAANVVDTKEFQVFKTYILSFASNAASLTLVCWSKASDEDFVTKMDLILSDMPQKLKPCMPDVTALYFAILRAMKLQRSDSLLLGKTLVSLVDLLLENLSTHSKDEFEILWEGLIFLIAFVADPHSDGANNNELKLIPKKVDVLLKKASHLISPLDDKKYFFRSKVIPFDFVMEMGLVKDMIRQLYYNIPDSSVYNFPKTIGKGFLDTLIQNLRNLKKKPISDVTCVSFAKYLFTNIEEQLVSLRPFFNDILQLQEDQNELNATWLRVINLVYLAEHVIDSCFVFDYPIWYHMASLSNVLDRIIVVNIELEKIKKCNMHNFGFLPCSASSLNVTSEQTWTSEVNELVVGFEEESNTIIDKLTRGHKSLDIVSIVGMAGIGKTTLARKVYGTPLVKCCFNIFAFFSVSKDHSSRRLLIDILSQITLIDDGVSSMTEEDLAHKLWKRLSQRKFLIVLDDIWDIRAWNEVKSSFPDDQNGSRVVLTTRFHKVAKEARIRCSPYALSFLSEDKSRELLQKKVFSNGSFPPDLSEVGDLIAKGCNGLPLAIVVIAGLLARTERSLSWWTEISERVGFYLSEEGLMEILELSYKHLPGHLKPCLLYFGAFPEDMLIPLKSLMQLWIAEGFIQESETKSLEDYAKEYLKDLADRSLIIVNARSSRGGIKTLGIHDLIHDFCRMKARAENFFILEPGIAASSSSGLPIYNHYRVCVQAGKPTVDATPTFPSMRSLLCFQRCNDPFDTQSIVGRFKLVQVLYLENMWLEEYDLEQLSLLVHLRHIVAPVNRLVSVPSSMSSLWKLETFTLRTMRKGEVLLPETIWKMERLRHVNISRCKLTFSDSHKHELYPQLGNVESFSSPTLSTGNDLQELLKRLPAIRKLSCRFDKSLASVEIEADIQVETLDFLCQIESLNLAYIGHKSPYAINFPSTLKKLKLVGFKLPWTAISDISKLPYLEVLKLLWNSFVGPCWDLEDVEFPRLKFLKMNGLNLVRWNASPDSFPCLEQLLVIGCEDLVEIPNCFGEISTLKRFEVHDCHKKAAISANQIKNDQRELGNESIEVAISNSF